ncbi:hypothetical protein M8756_08515 [Lutimaribacter sp. EGI FJ00015]|uniref:Uncharacterized protein n=1 Tax=Lutimaribacter degradans TaxID=2945989 RepID=A0ACC5ZV96_9RHOB|nr:hypothetical protein [Lutimaribacter sp. EGI FJ00013]MCM2562196.1 hypothetical protein [Lutimaribacter sp. EGI FJ00013]MCO0613351.1 hypothetical protein [Lutimaribacter sp. EGI FJ00015]MCO0636325.1 hypothetical protein [Lutimaribacter sp. EGI FJ00014]
MSFDSELALVVGFVLCVFAIPSIVSAFSDRRAPRVATLVLMAGGGLVVWAIATKPGGYNIEDIPDVFVRVVARFI